MEIEGRLLNFDDENELGYMFSKDCKIDIPDVIPITKGFNISDNGKVVGSAIVKKDENGLSVSGTIFDDEIASDNIDFGGYFTNIKMEEEKE